VLTLFFLVDDCSKGALGLILLVQFAIDRDENSNSHCCQNSKDYEKEFFHNNYIIGIWSDSLENKEEGQPIKAALLWGYRLMKIAEQLCLSAICAETLVYFTRYVFVGWKK
jgi:hypothetical protein